MQELLGALLNFAKFISIFLLETPIQLHLPGKCFSEPRRPLDQVELGLTSCSHTRNRPVALRPRVASDVVVEGSVRAGGQPAGVHHDVVHVWRTGGVQSDAVL